MNRPISLLILLALFLSACGAPAATPPPLVENTVAPTTAEQPTAVIPPTGETAVPTTAASPVTESAFTLLGVLNRDTTQAAFSPSLVVNRAATDNQSGLWAVWTENLSGGQRQIFSSELQG